MADMCGMGRHLIPEVADALKAEGLLEKDAQFATVDQMLDGLERTSSRLAVTVNTPPLDVASLRNEWEMIREEARHVQPGRLPSRDTVNAIWSELKTEAARQNRSVFETSSMLALATVRVGTLQTGRMLGTAAIDHYRQTLGEMREAGYVRFAARQLQPYVSAAAAQFAPSRKTLTQRMLEKLRMSG
jgi:hypothetical protein